jgi:hypothetical protein
MFHFVLLVFIPVKIFILGNLLLRLIFDYTINRQVETNCKIPFIIVELGGDGRINSRVGTVGSLKLS